MLGSINTVTYDVTIETILWTQSWPGSPQVALENTPERATYFASKARERGDLAEPIVE